MARTGSRARCSCSGIPRTAREEPHNEQGAVQEPLEEAMGNKKGDDDEGEDEKSYLEGLLDGIIPVEHQAKNSSFVTSLADMAVGCLIRGGVGMSRTLHGFLGRSSDYDASRASLMLAATASNAIAEMEEMKKRKFSVKLNSVHKMSSLWQTKRDDQLQNI